MLARLALAGLVLVTSMGGAAAQPYERELSPEHPAIGYWETELDDPVSRLERELSRGGVELAFDENGLSYLPSLLEQLGVDASSQTLVLSKTSLQRHLVSPRTPRAIYFSDDVAIGFIPEAETIELAAIDPELGPVFFLLSTRRSPRPHFERPRVCLECHHGPATLGVAGLYVGSVATSVSGRADFRLGSLVTDHRTPFEARWGGWYVDGASSALVHRGNAVGADPELATVLALASSSNGTSLHRRFDTRRYPSPASDIVALMTLEHQTQMTNLLVRLGWEARIAAAEGAEVPEARIEEVLAYMLFVDEAPLEGPVHGVSSFAETFPQRGPRDRKGRSLRDLDLEHRLFRYPLSYLIHSAAFDALEDGVRDRLYRRLYTTLTASVPTGRFARLSDEDRRAILEILEDTKPALPAYWREAPVDP